MNTQSYTMQLVESMMNGLIESKTCKGYRRMNNGLYEDCLGQVYTVSLDQTSSSMEDGSSFSEIKLQFKPVDIAAGRI